eukprot:3190525-Amphidinium_carterae.1
MMFDTSHPHAHAHAHTHLPSIECRTVALTKNRPGMGVKCEKGSNELSEPASISPIFARQYPSQGPCNKQAKCTCAF